MIWLNWCTINRNHLLIVCRLTIFLTINSLLWSPFIELLLLAALLLVIFIVVFLMVVLVWSSLLIVLIIIFSPVFALHILSRHTPLLLLLRVFVVGSSSTMSKGKGIFTICTMIFSRSSGSGHVVILCDLILWVYLCYLGVLKLDAEVDGCLLGERLLLGLWLLRVEGRRGIADSILLKSGWHKDVVGLCSFFTWLNVSCCHRINLLYFK